MRDIFEKVKDPIYLLVFMSLGIVSFGIVAFVLAPLFLSIGYSELLSQSMDGSIYQNIAFVKLMQLFQSIGLFILPAFFYSKHKTGNIVENLDLDKKVVWKAVPLLFLLFWFGNPFIALLGHWNSQMELPAFLSSIEQWMIEKESMAAETTRLFLEGERVIDLLINVLVVAIVPAIGEELIFRGILQKKLVRSMTNPHVAIFLSAVIFSAIHLQFYGFFPRLVLGLGLGYLYYWSGSLWISIIAHFLNNGMAVVVVFFTSDLSNVIPDPDAPLDLNPFLLLGSVVFTAAVLYQFKRIVSSEVSVEDY